MTVSLIETPEGANPARDWNTPYWWCETMRESRRKPMKWTRLKRSVSLSIMWGRHGLSPVNEQLDRVSGFSHSVLSASFYSKP